MILNAALPTRTGCRLFLLVTREGLCEVRLGDGVECDAFHGTLDHASGTACRSDGSQDQLAQYTCGSALMCASTGTPC
ncbi:MAG TPA: hypothetical protein PLI17_07195, partial [Denitromonas sp.]|nr:hypothetical protein [Denitromonas sp.]